MYRVEDDRLLRGQGKFLEDQVPDNALHVFFVRAPIAHGRVIRLHTGSAEAMDGVAAILTADDVSSFGAIPCEALLPGMADIRRPLIAASKVNHLGEIIAMLVADTLEQAMDAAEAIEVEYQESPAVADPATASQHDQPLLHKEAPRNLAYHWQTGHADATNTAFEEAAHVIDIEVVNSRIAVNPLENRGAIGFYDPDHQSYTLRTQTQGVHRIRDNLADSVLFCERGDLRVVNQDVGGAFGIRLQTYPEQALVLIAARRCLRPVVWVAQRTESFLADAHGRAQLNRGALAVDAQGRFLGLKISSIADLGSYLSTYSPPIASTAAVRAAGHCYRIPVVHMQVSGVFTNNHPVDSYRGAGKPEIVYLLERLVEKTARMLNIDRIDLRRRNLITPDEMPLLTAVSQTLDSGDFPGALEKALWLSGFHQFEQRRKQSLEHGKRRGIGVGMYLHSTGGFANEISTLRVHPAGYVEVNSGTQAAGQGHQTVFTHLIADRMGIAPQSVIVRQGDSNWLPHGGGTGGSSSLPIAAVNLCRAADLLIDRGRELAAQELETAVIDIDYKEGRFQVVGTDRGMDIFELAKRLDPGGENSTVEFSAGCDFQGPYATYPNGCYVCEVEVDPLTGTVDVLRFTAIDDIGRVLNEDIARGQIHGGIVQSIGQALMEQCVYDPQSGQLLSGSFMDYCLPRADDLPFIDTGFAPTSTDANLLGVKGVGEVGCIGATAPVVNAVLDALRPLGVDHLDMPLSPQNVWNTIDSVKGT